jgi:23S rRNA pseudouridine1911/1915/1917 synthase
MPSETVQESARRLDQWLASRHAEHSRARWQTLIRAGCVTVNGVARKPNSALRPGDEIAYAIPEPEPAELVAEDIPLEILYEDADLIAINKPPGRVVHPAPGHASGTLVNALLNHCKDLGGIGGERRPGIVHRLDRDTSGVLVVAKNEPALTHLAAQFKNRRVVKLYLALVRGIPRPAAGTIRTLIGRSERNRKKMSAHVRRGREAISHYETVEVFPGAALLRVRIETGRTHQIRVHLAHIGHPVIGDTVYGRAARNEPRPPRQMLHAARLSLAHPRTGRNLCFEAPMPADMAAVAAALKA